MVTESYDKEVLIRVSELTQVQQTFQTTVLEKLNDIDKRLSITENRLEWLQTTVYWGFAIIAFIAAFVPAIKK